MTEGYSPRCEVGERGFHALTGSGEIVAQAIFLGRAIAVTFVFYKGHYGISAFVREGKLK